MSASSADTPTGDHDPRVFEVILEPAYPCSVRAFSKALG